MSGSAAVTAGLKRKRLSFFVRTAAAATIVVHFLHASLKIQRSPTSKIDSSVQAVTKEPRLSEGDLFICGWELPTLAQKLFPRHTFRGVYKPRSHDNENTVIVFGSFGLCAGLDETEFEGKIIYVNGEGHENMYTPLYPHRSYQIGGPRRSHPFILPVYYFAVELIDEHYDVINSILDPSQRPRWNGNKSRIIYVNSNCVKHRQDAASQLGQILPVDHGGHCEVKGVTNKVQLKSSGHSKLSQDLSAYKYCISMENSQVDGYISEKLLNAFLSGCIPIYWGTLEVFDVFNNDAFVWWDTKNPMYALDTIRRLESQPELYEKMAKAPILRNGDETIREYFSLSDEIGNGELKNKVHKMMGFH